MCCCSHSPHPEELQCQYCIAASNVSWNINDSHSVRVSSCIYRKCFRSINLDVDFSQVAKVKCFSFTLYPVNHQLSFGLVLCPVFHSVLQYIDDWTDCLLPRLRTKSMLLTKHVKQDFSAAANQWKVMQVPMAASPESTLMHHCR